MIPDEEAIVTAAAQRDADYAKHGVVADERRYQIGSHKSPRTSVCTMSQKSLADSMSSAASARTTTFFNAEAFFELRDGEKLRFAGVDSCLTRREDFSMPWRRLNLFLFLGERGPEPFQSLKPLGRAQARYFFFQFKDAHHWKDSSRALRTQDW